MITVNNIKHQIPENKMELILSTWLREDLYLTGTKIGCGIGVCGSCTVLVDGEAKRSCKLKLKDVLGKQIITIEGISDPDGSLHPLQQAFIDAGAIQCGFCTPGMVLSALALLLKNHHPSRAEIREAIKGNICRCTGYQQIVDAVEAAAHIMYS
ncbi:MAG: (2Fe-2S)-binding protein [Candidatus Cloacimonetes bacterium]|jgi:carbon-monoxide dehydrogenase small subunit|nr:(2Fe-2S)-binding protein [Candidatus Cloacimonadota bacterium]MCK9334292.1 (2Fe-2S)-binding protein [Candidatus Cloacimonadota bacterium]MDD2544296.1 (2Fe-2S)-binding protein [Candidatus Cloacimonadota bacterium]MDD2682954.1 (2Fe-2S)-binding protein [Candidatus Cloacimonadota bacterium]MDD3096626.1 (2Fe-2S)-binding protein [Candidatus Cloacimonadota bacterium]